jgi:hypothetical protein
MFQGGRQRFSETILRGSAEPRAHLFAEVIKPRRRPVRRRRLAEQTSLIAPSPPRREPRPICGQAANAGCKLPAYLYDV